MIYENLYGKIKSIYIPREPFLNFVCYAFSAENEVGGVMIGFISGDQVKVEKIIIGENICSSLTGFQMDLDSIGMILSELKEDEDIVGIIHSHPTHPIPSQVDKENMLFWPVIWLIVRLTDGKYKAWYFDREVNVKLY